MKIKLEIFDGGVRFTPVIIFRQVDQRHRVGKRERCFAVADARRKILPPARIY